MGDVGDLAADLGLAGGPLAGDREPRPYVLTINGGSSSLKFALYPVAGPSEPILFGRIERVGRGESRLVASGIGGSGRESHAVEAPDQAAAARLVIEHLERDSCLAAIAAIGHRVVHGGVHFTEPMRVTPQMLDQLRRISPLDPEHLPGEIDLIEAFGGAVPGVPQVACFDTGFHRTMPRPAQIVPIPRKFWGLGIRRYGFHGLSYTYLMEELERIAGSTEARGRVVLATSARVRAWRQRARAGAWTPRWGSPLPPAWSWARAAAT